MTTVITGIYGDVDVPKEPWPQTVETRWVFVSDRLDKPGGYDEFIYDEPDFRHPRLQAKEPKLRPWKFVPEEEDAWIWIDGSMQVISKTFVAEVLHVVADWGLIGQWKHPDRDCIYPEADLSATLPKYAQTPVLDQVEHYANQGHPPHWGLWATGLIVYTKQLDYLADLWWAEMNRWGYQDQISQPVALRRAGIRPVELPYDLRGNPWITLHPHLTHL